MRRNDELFSHLINLRNRIPMLRHLKKTPHMCYLFCNLLTQLILAAILRETFLQRLLLSMELFAQCLMTCALALGVESSGC